MIERYTEKHKEIWDKAVDNSSNGTFMHKRDFISYHPEGKFKDHSVIIDGKFLFPANEAGFHIYSHQGLSYAGLISPKNVKLTEYLKAFYQLLNYYEERKFDSITYKQAPSIYSDELSGNEDYALFLSGANCYRQDSNVVVDLEKDVRLSDRKKRNISRAKKTNFLVKKTDDWQAYWNDILIPCLKNSHNTSPTHTLQEILYIKEKFPNNVSFEGVYDSRYEKRLIGGVVWYKHKDAVLHSQYIASTPECKENNGLDLLFSEHVCSLISHPRYLSFGICNEDEGKYLNSGLVNWKSEFGGEVVTHKYHKIDLNQNFENLKRNI